MAVSQSHILYQTRHCRRLWHTTFETQFSDHLRISLYTKRIYRVRLNTVCNHLTTSLIRRWDRFAANGAIHGWRWDLSIHTMLSCQSYFCMTYPKILFVWKDFCLKQYLKEILKSISVNQGFAQLIDAGPKFFYFYNNPTSKFTTWQTSSFQTLWIIFRNSPSLKILRKWSL